MPLPFFSTPLSSKINDNAIQDPASPISEQMLVSSANEKISFRCIFPSAGLCGALANVTEDFIAGLCKCFLSNLPKRALDQTLKVICSFAITADVVYDNGLPELLC